MANEEQKTTHFGFETVAEEEKIGRVRHVFDSVASKYDIMNDVMSMGVHRLWKRFAIETAGVRPGNQVLDLASGTCDLALRFSQIVGPTGKVIASDINGSMLSCGRERMINEGAVGNVEYVLANAESLPFKDNQFDCVTISFGLRNVTHKDVALRSIQRVLKPGGRLLVLEFSKPVVPGLDKVYDAYSFKLLPFMGKVVAQDEDSYRYLAESIRMHPGQDELKQMMIDAGLERCEYFNLSGGIVALHRGYKL